MKIYEKKTFGPYVMVFFSTAFGSGRARFNTLMKSVVLARMRECKYAWDKKEEIKRSYKHHHKFLKWCKLQININLEHAINYYCTELKTTICHSTLFLHLSVYIPINNRCILSNAKYTLRICNNKKNLGTFDVVM